MEKGRDNDRRDSRVWVTYGVNEISLDTLAGRTLAEARKILRATLDIPEGARAIGDDGLVDEGDVITSGEVLEFIAEAGKMK